MKREPVSCSVFLGLAWAKTREETGRLVPAAPLVATDRDPVAVVTLAIRGVI